MFLNKRGISILTIILWVIIIGAIVIFAPRIYNYYIEQNTIKIIKSNTRSVEDEIRSQLIDKHPVLIWNDIGKLIKELKMQNPVSRDTQVKNAFKDPGAVAVHFDGMNTFTIDGIDSNGRYLNINIKIIK